MDSSDEAEQLLGYQSIAPGLPPASSDKRKWWFDGDKSVASTMGPPQPGMILNKNREPNPWRDGSEDDWILIEHESKQSNRFKPPPPKPRVPSRNQASSTSAPASNPPSQESTPAPQKYTEARSSPAAYMAGVWPHSRNISNATLPRPSPPLPAPRNSKKVVPEGNDVVDLRSNISRSASIASTTTPASASTSVRSSKQAPQRPSKPSALSSHRTSTSVNDESLRSLSPHPEADAVESDSLTDGKPPPLPKRTNTSLSTVSRTDSIQSNGPPLPPRRTNNKSTSGRDLLSDEVYDSQGTSWKPLTPSR